METDTYMLLHRMHEVAKTRKELHIARRRFQAVINAYKDSKIRDDLFAVAWALSCTADLNWRLQELTFAENDYLASIELFEQIDMPEHSGNLSANLARLYLEQGRVAEVEQKLQESVSYRIAQWGSSSHHTVTAQEVLTHFHNTRKIINRHHYGYCEACGIDENRKKGA